MWCRFSVEFFSLCLIRFISLPVNRTTNVESSCHANVTPQESAASGLWGRRLARFTGWRWTTSHVVFILCQLRLCLTRFLHHTLSVDPALRRMAAVFPVELDANFCHFKSNYASPPDVVNGLGDLFWAVNLCLCQSLWGGRVATRSVISLL